MISILNLCMKIEITATSPWLERVSQHRHDQAPIALFSVIEIDLYLQGGHGNILWSFVCPSVRPSVRLPHVEVSAYLLPNHL